MKLLLFLLIVGGLALVVFYPRDRFKFEKITERASLKRFDENFGPRIKAAEKFSKALINSYRHQLESDLTDISRVISFYGKLISFLSEWSFRHSTKL